MSEATAIQWTATYHADGTVTPGKTWNPWQGCTKVSPGCAHCYMFRDKMRYGQDPATVIRSKDPTFYAPLKWRDPALVFTCSWSDWFHAAADPWRAEAWDIIRRTPHLTYQILTKRPERIAACLPADWGNGYPNVWLGVSIENNRFVGRYDILRTIPAAVRFVSAEPLLGWVDVDWLAQGPFHRPGPPPDWIIIGGESGGREARPLDLETVEGMITNCRNWGIACFVKQLGSVWARAARAHDGHGGDITEWPAALQVREFPAQAVAA